MNEVQGPVQGSEVARLLKQIRAEFEAAQRGLTGLAQGIGKHEFITTKMDNMGKRHDELRALVGDKAAIALVAEVLDTVPENSPSI